MAGIEDGGEPHTGLEGLHEDAVHFVINDVAGSAEVDGVDHFIVAVVFVAVEVLGLTAVTCAPWILRQLPIVLGLGGGWQGGRDTDLSNGRRASHWVWRPL